MEDYVLSAIQKGLREIVFLEHMEAGVNYFETTWLSEKDFDDYFFYGEALQEKYRKEIDIKLGVEVGYSAECHQELIDRLAARKWDRVGLSYHFHKMAGMPHHLNLVSRKKINIEAIEQHGPDTILSKYYDTLIQAVKTFPATVLCHLDAALRFQKNHKPKKSHLTQIATLLDLVQEKRLAVEINTSGFAIRDEQFPSSKILQMLLTRDIPLFIGSDAHRPKDVGRFFAEIPPLLRTLTLQGGL